MKFDVIDSVFFPIHRDKFYPFYKTSRCLAAMFVYYETSKLTHDGENSFSELLSRHVCLYIIR